MTVQIQPAKPKEQHNGLQALEADLIKDDDQTVLAIVTYKVAKVVKDKKTNDFYPVVYVVAIEPVLGEHTAKADELHRLAYQARTGENELDLNFDGSDDSDGDVAAKPAAAKKPAAKK